MPDFNIKISRDMIRDGTLYHQETIQRSVTARDAVEASIKAAVEARMLDRKTVNAVRHTVVGVDQSSR